jgi:hypothetical protein
MFIIVLITIFIWFFYPEISIYPLNFFRWYYNYGLFIIELFICVFLLWWIESIKNQYIRFWLRSILIILIVIYFTPTTGGKHFLDKLKLTNEFLNLMHINLIKGQYATAWFDLKFAFENLCIYLVMFVVAHFVYTFYVNTFWWAVIDILYFMAVLKFIYEMIRFIYFNKNDKH